MTTYSKEVWEQLKGKSLSDIVHAMTRDGFVADYELPDVRGHKSAICTYVRARDGRKVTIHRHPRVTYGPGLLKKILDDVGWSEGEMKRLKLIK